MNLRDGRPLALHEIVELLHEARARTLLLTSGLSQEDLAGQHNPLMSPIVWDLGHIAHFEDVWLIEKLVGGALDSEGLRGMYNPFENPRATRPELDLPSPQGALEYMGAIRSNVVNHLRGVDLGRTDALLADGFVFRMVLQHEYQHNETILQTLQLKAGDPYPAPRAYSFAPVIAPSEPEMVAFEGGLVRLGTDDRSAAYDNERPVHSVEMRAFAIDRLPVTNGAYLEFMEDGGYEERAHWSEGGRAWLTSERASSPAYWWKEGGSWMRRTMDLVGPVDPSRPVCHVCFYEAEAYAKWAGKRLPTEQEWEVAACWDPAAGRARAFPWGDEPPTQAQANIDVLAFDTAPVGTYADSVSPLGCYGMIGDVWEWTASDFLPYPGYETFPYKEYSEVFFGSEYKVLRGGSWATRSGAIRSTFRNWDYPIRRQIFSGFRCAEDLP